MPEFKGFDDWVPIFRGGKQRDSQGREHDGDALIDQAVSKFNAAAHEPPACVGHPADNKPAYGWVSGLKKGTDRLGNILLAKFRQVEPTFAGMVQGGRFKKRSAAFYPDGTLRHVAFLGAAPPAVKGLPDMAFAEEAGATFEFADYQTVWSWEAIAALFGRLRDYLIEKDGVEKADAVISQYQIKEIFDAAAKEKQEIQTENAAQAQPIYHEKEAGEMDFKEFIQKLKELVLGAETSAAAAAPAAAAAGKTFSEADLDARLKAAAEEAARKERERVTAEFAERDRKARQDALGREISSWCDTQVKAGRLTPAMVKFGIPEMLLAFAEKEDQIEFGETKEKATLFDRFKALIETELPKVVTFKEVATRDKDAGGLGADGGKLESLIQAKMKENKELSYSAAFAEVQKENPDLARQYAAEFKEV
jgi:hypothetical protein